MTDSKPTMPCGAPVHRRHAAGEDPAKRDQIIDGAGQVFFDNGFDGASMNDICRAAKVSKGTIYVYFADKCDLFEALVARERERLFVGVRAILDADLPLEEKLGAFGRRLAEIICSDHVIRAQRIIIGAAEKLPEMGARFYDAGAKRAQGELQQFFEREIAAGRLQMPDPSLAAMQFAELCSVGLWRQRLFAKAPTPPTGAQIDATVDSAVAMFLAAYGNGDSK